MSITKVKFDKLFSTSSYLNDRIGIEVTVENGQDPITALKEASRLAIEFNKMEYPELYRFNDKPMTAAEVDFVIQINQCETLQKLSRFKGSTNATTKKYYMDKVKELSDKPVYEKIDMP